MGRFTKKSVTIEAVRYRCGEQPSDLTGDVVAGRIRYVEDGTALIDTLEGSMVARDGDWIIRGVKGELYPCKPDIFEATYAPERAAVRLAGLTFGEALEALKAGARICRAGWNGKGMWLRLVLPYSDSQFKVTEMPGAQGTLLPWIGMKTADNGFVPWLASQTDMLAEDWMLVEHGGAAIAEAQPMRFEGADCVALAEPSAA